LLVLRYNATLEPKSSVVFLPEAGIIFLPSVYAMPKLLKALGLLLLLLMAQQGAVVHELSHVSRLSHAGAQLDSRAAADTTCAQCPAFAQVVTPAFSHAFHIPVMVLIATQRSSELRIVAIEAAVPHPRSRGPPSLS
jgi:hypothetical protein